MSLIKVKELGFGIDGKSLDITIAIPTGSYLRVFRVYNQKDLIDTNCEDAPGIDYIEQYQMGGTKEEAFHRLFSAIEGCVEDGYTLYKLDSSKLPNVSQKDLTLIAMELEADSVSALPSTPSCCGEDSTVLTVPLYELLPLRLKALDAVSLIDNSCDIPKEFIDLLLQIKAIELALCCKDFCKAAEYWNRFMNSDKIKVRKGCGCSGKTL